LNEELEFAVRYAYVGSERVEPTKGQRAICACCGGEVVAKCGQFKTHHWAHKTLETCDPWWENESDWHRDWKSYFPPERQEFVFRAQVTGERHIADVYSEKGVVLKFQSYSIAQDEVEARERFYGQMIWVVNGCKNPFDKTYFNMSIHHAHTSDPMLRKIDWIGRGKIFAKWTLAKKHVYLDFGSDVVWHLIEYNQGTKNGMVKAYPKKQFVEFFGGVFVHNN